MTIKKLNNGIFDLSKLKKHGKNKGKRVGRGIGSGLGKTAGRGHKGQKARTGVSINGFEGGQTPLYRRLPRRGFKNHMFKKSYVLLNFDRIEDWECCKKGDITKQMLVDCGFISNISIKIKLLGNGEVKKAFNIEVDAASASAIKKMEAIGGIVKLIGIKN